MIAKTRRKGLWGCTCTSCPTVFGLITGVNEGKEPELWLSDALSPGSAVLLGLNITGSQAQKPTSAVGSMTDTAQLTAAAHTHKSMYIHMHEPYTQRNAHILYLTLKETLSWCTPR